MQVEIKLDSGCEEPKVLILTAAVTEEVKALLDKLSADTPQLLTGFREERLEILDPEKIVRIYASAGKVLAVTEAGEYALRLRLYEVEQRLDPRRFVRISNSEIVQLAKVKHFDLSFTGTICVRLTNGETTYVSRRCVPKVKKILGL